MPLIKPPTRDIQMVHPASVFGLALVVACVATRVTYGVEFTITDLGTLPELSENQLCYATAVNDRGHVAGYCSDFIDGKLRRIAFVWNSSELIKSLGAGGDDHSFSLGINNHGDVVGYSYTDSSEYLDTRAFYYSDGRFNRLNTPSASYSIAKSINDSRIIAGSLDDDVLLYNQGSHVNVGRLGSGRMDANAINQLGDVVGSGVLYYDDDGYPVERAFLFRDGELLDLGNINEGGSSALAINDQRQAVGYAEPGGITDYGYPIRHAVLFENGSVIDVNPFHSEYSYAVGINNLGWFIGSYVQDNNYRLFVDIKNRPHDIYSLIPTSSRWSIGDLTDINERGQIVGHGLGPHGDYRAFLLTPVPEPSTAILSLVALAGAAASGRWRRVAEKSRYHQVRLGSQGQ